MGDAPWPHTVTLERFISRAFFSDPLFPRFHHLLDPLVDADADGIYHPAWKFRHQGGSELGDRATAASARCGRFGMIGVGDGYAHAGLARSVLSCIFSRPNPLDSNASAASLPFGLYCMASAFQAHIFCFSVCSFLFGVWSSLDRSDLFCSANVNVPCYLGSPTFSFDPFHLCSTVLSECTVAQAFGCFLICVSVVSRAFPYLRHLPRHLIDEG